MFDSRNLLIESNVGPFVVRELRGVVCEKEPGTIGIVVSPRLNFTEIAINEAKASKYIKNRSNKSKHPIILTDISHLPQ
ncbi:12859_t:CDS:1, partial [Cetraspora pellucida]